MWSNFAPDQFWAWSYTYDVTTTSGFSSTQTQYTDAISIVNLHCRYTSTKDVGIIFGGIFARGQGHSTHSIITFPSGFNLRNTTGSNVKIEGIIMDSAGMNGSNAIPIPYLQVDASGNITMHFCATTNLTTFYFTAAPFRVDEFVGD